MSISKKFLQAITTSLCLIGGVVLLHSYLGAKTPSSSLGMLLAQRNNTARNLSSSVLSEDKILEALLQDMPSISLLDSVLTILREFYVDEHRTETKDLLEKVLQQLNLTHSLQYSLREDILTASINRQVLNVSIDGIEEQDSKFMMVLYGIGILLDQANGHDGKIISDKEVLRTLLNTLLETLDAHSNLMSKEEFEELRQGTEGKFGGLGILVGVNDSVLTVIKPMPKSPAERIGITSMDKILSINGVRTYEHNLDDLIENMRGMPGTTVNLSLLREGALSAYSVKLKREIIQVDAVTSDIIETEKSRILHLQIESFSSKTTEQARKVVFNFLKKNDPAKRNAVIIDLRGNPGGLLDQAISVSSLFMKEGIIVSTRGKRNETERADGSAIPENIPVMVLVDGESASASEIVASALQGNDRVVVLGEPSYGKGSVQTIFDLPEKMGLKLTIARFYSPDGHSLQNTGVIPDIWLHAVKESKENSNLIGDMRYKSEKFLSNRLDPSIGEEKTSSYKGYYLMPEITKKEELKKKDVVLEMSTSLLDQAQFHDKIFSRKIFLHENENLITKMLQKGTDLVENFLQEKHQIEWVKSNKTQGIVSLQLEIEDQIEAYLGDEINIPFNINLGGKNIFERVSIFVRSENNRFPTFEKLLGTVNVNGYKGILPLRIPGSFSEGTGIFEIGASLDGNPIMQSIKTLKIKLKDKQRPALETHFALDEEKGGTVQGKLEAKESAQVVLNIKNTSSVAARKIDIKLVNLAGKQIEVLSDVSQIPVIEANREFTVKIPVRGNSKVVSADLNLGLLLQSDDLKTPIRKELDIKAVPSAL